MKLIIIAHALTPLDFYFKFGSKVYESKLVNQILSATEIEIQNLKKAHPEVKKILRKLLRKTKLNKVEVWRDKNEIYLS